MNRPLRILKSARGDVAAAEARYAEEKPGLGASFVMEVGQTLKRIEAYPESYQTDFAAVRRAGTHRFPFAVYYRVLADAIEVAAILDCRLDPAAVHARLAGSSSSKS